MIFVGDCDYNTGPSNVNKDFKRYLSEKMYFLKYKNKILRAIEVIIHVFLSDTVIISGLSVINNLALDVAVISHKHIIYLMHGCYAYESKMNLFKENKKAIRLEQKMLRKSHKIITVSERYMGFVSELFGEYADKLTFINNGIEWSDYEKTNVHEMRDPFLILSMGGGRPQKNNIVVCDAVKILNEKYNLPFRYVVLGRDYLDTPKIKEKEYTEYVGQVPRNEVEVWLHKTSIYIQNSSFESFGLAPIEALCHGCNILLSQNIGAISILKTVSEDDLIKDCMDSEEIAEKIIKVYKNNNQARLIKGIDRSTSSCRYSAKRLLNIAENL